MFPGVIEEQPLTWIRNVGVVFARFGAETQDSGNISYGVDIGSVRYFVKTAGDPAATDAYSSFEARQQGLRNAARLAETVDHALLPAFHGVVESPGGPVLVYDWREGEHLGTSAGQSADPASGFERFRGLPVDEIVGALDQLYDLAIQPSPLAGSSAATAWQAASLRRTRHRKQPLRPRPRCLIRRSR
jgi:serine/threonine-protein kinase